MNEVYRFSLSSDVVVAVDPSSVRHAPEQLHEKIRKIWTEGKKETPVFESPIVSLVRYSSTHLIGELVDFSVWYACLKDPSLRQALDIHPLGVTGVTRWQDAILIGKRSANLAVYGGAMECCPSGSIDLSSIRRDGTVDLSGALLSELHEEAGIEPPSVRSSVTKSLYFSKETGIFDIHIDIELYPEEDHSILKPPSREYDELVWIQKDEVGKAFSKRAWVPLSLHLLQERCHEIH